MLPIQECININLLSHRLQYQIWWRTIMALLPSWQHAVDAFYNGPDRRFTRLSTELCFGNIRHVYQTFANAPYRPGLRAVRAAGEDRFKAIAAVELAAGIVNALYLSKSSFDLRLKPSEELATSSPAAFLWAVTPLYAVADTACDTRSDVPDLLATHLGIEAMTDPNGDMFLPRLKLALKRASEGRNPHKEYGHVTAAMRSPYRPAPR